MPQGSILGPRLFSIYTYDLPASNESGSVGIYTDDTTTSCFGKDEDDVQCSLQELRTQCYRHKLTVHPGKSNGMILNRRKLIGPLQHLNMIEYSGKCECLGIIIDNKINWEPQEKRSETWGIYFLDEIYLKLVVPAVLYTFTVWGNCSDSLFKELEKYIRLQLKLYTNYPEECPRTKF